MYFFEDNLSLIRIVPWTTSQQIDIKEDIFEYIFKMAAIKFEYLIEQMQIDSDHLVRLA